MWDRDGNPTLLAAPSAVLDETFGYDVNNNGVVAGFNNDLAGSAFNATVWDRQGVPTNLQTFSGASPELSTGLNNKGEAVGTDFATFSGRSGASGVARRRCRPQELMSSVPRSTSTTAARWSAAASAAVSPRPL